MSFSLLRAKRLNKINNTEDGIFSVLSKDNLDNTENIPSSVLFILFNLLALNNENDIVPCLVIENVLKILFWLSLQYIRMLDRINSLELSLIMFILKLMTFSSDDDF